MSSLNNGRATTPTRQPQSRNSVIPTRQRHNSYVNIQSYQSRPNNYSNIQNYQNKRNQPARSSAHQQTRSRSPVPSMMGTISDISHNVEITPNAVTSGARWTAAQNKSHLYDPNYFTIEDNAITPRSVKPDCSPHQRADVKELANYAQNL